MKAPRMPLPAIRLPKQAAIAKTFFLSRAFREKVLLLGFVVLVAATWFSSAAGRARRLYRDFSLTTRELAMQRGWLDQRVSIEAAARAAVEHLDPGKTFDGVRLQAEMDAIAKKAGVTNFTVDNGVPERISQFTMNAVQVTLRNVDYPVLIRFYQEVSLRAPYIGLEQVRVSVNNGKHSATMRVTSIELAK